MARGVVETYRRRTVFLRQPYTFMLFICLYHFYLLGVLNTNFQLSEPQRAPFAWEMLFAENGTDMLSRNVGHYVTSDAA